MHKCFRKKKKKTTLYIFSPFEGVSKPLEKIKGAKCIEGSGVVVVPESNKKIVNIQAPIAGEVFIISPLGDKVGIRSDNGIEILVKVIAIQEKLKRTGVSPFVFKGQWVNVGDQLTSMHVEHIKEQADFKGVAVVVTSGQKVVEKKIGEVTMFDKILIVGE